ncbi:MAG: bifunctional riboflavin kinase/FAD synthetase [Bacteroidales bacterium]|nr:bifunctional riboflavin kinase/FAD synthetase [Bacteroidales bacterium]
MIIHEGYFDLHFRDPVVTMGVFDGVHLGHRMLLGRVVAEAGKSRSDAVAVTFDPHPRIVLTGDPSHLRFLTDIEERIYLLRQTGIDHLVIIPFTPELSRMTAEEFVDSILCRHLGLRHLITGFNHHFGRRHEGDTKTIIECSGKMDFRVTREEAFMIGGEAVSSSLIRGLLKGGDTRKASAMLGYDYSLKGKVVSGKRIGRGMGFPTANIAPSFVYKLIPGAGVYAVEIMVEGDHVWHVAMLNIGVRPTITENDGRSTIEAHIIDFESDLYGKTVTVRFRERLRDEMKFDSIDSLAAQLAMDRERTIALLRR